MDYGGGGSGTRGDEDVHGAGKNLQALSVGGRV